MFTRLIFAFALACTVGGDALAQSDPIDLIPTKAAAAIVIRDADDLRKKGDDFLKETGLNLPLRPSEALDFVKTNLGIKDGLDLKQPAAAVLLRPDGANNPVGLEDLGNSVYIALAFTDLDAMAANFGFAKGALKRGAITKTQVPNDVKFILAQGKHVFLAPTSAPLERLRGVKSVAGELSVEQRKAFGGADVLLHVNPKALGADWTELRRALAEEFGKTADPQEKESLSQFVKTLESMRFGLGGMRLDHGLALNLLTMFPKEKDAPARAFLATLRARGSANLKGLPAGNVLAAQAYAGDSAKNAVLARALVNFLLQNVLETKHITSATDRPAFVGVFNEVWQRLNGSRIAVYAARPGGQAGMFSAVAILDTDDPKQFLTDLRTLAKIADGTLDLTKKTPIPEIDFGQLILDLSAAKYQVRASATLRLRLIGEPSLPYLDKAAANPPDLETARRAQLLVKEIRAVVAERRRELLAKDLPRFVHPTFAFVGGAERRAGVPVDIIHIQLTEKDRLAAGPMAQLFGPEWDKLRLAIHGKHVAVLLGSETGLLDAALVNLNDGNAGLAQSKALAGFAKLPANQATAAFHLSLDKLLGLVSARAPGQSPELTSFALTAGERALQVDLFVPTADVAALVKNRLP